MVSYSHRFSGYSFGIVLWELAHLQTPYAGKEPMAVVMEVANNIRPPISPSVDHALRGTTN